MVTEKCIWAVFFCAILLVIAGCSYEGPYTFRQDLSNVGKVEIYEYDYTTGNRTLITELPEPQAQELVAELAGMTCYQYGPGDHPRKYGSLMIGITYTNNEVELIGLTNIGWIEPDGEIHLTDYCFDERVLFDLIVKYVDPALLPDLSDKYPGWLP